MTLSKMSEVLADLLLVLQKHELSDQDTLELCAGLVLGMYKIRETKGGPPLPEHLVEFMNTGVSLMRKTYPDLYEQLSAAVDTPGGLTSESTRTTGRPRRRVVG